MILFSVLKDLFPVMADPANPMVGLYTVLIVAATFALTYLIYKKLIGKAPPPK